MNHYLPIIVASLSCCLMLSCTPKNGKQLEKGEKMNFTSLTKGQYSGIAEKSDKIVTDMKTWTKLWAKMHELVEPKPPLPKVDFSKNTVLTVFMGTKNTGGYDISIHTIREMKDRIQVEVEEIVPRSSGIVTMALTQPFHVVKIAKSKKKIEFVRKRK